MKIQGVKYNKDDINKLLVNIAGKLAKDDHKYTKSVKHKHNLETLDVIVLLQKNRFKIDQLYDSLNYQLSVNNDVPTFFRSKDNRSFLFPGGANIHFYNNIEQFKRLAPRLNPIAVVCEPLAVSFIKEHITDIKELSFILVLE